MKRNFILRVSFLITILFLLILIIFNLNQNNKELIEKEVVKEEIESSNVIKDVSYKSKDSSGNEYILEASEGVIDQENNNIIYLTSIKAIIKLKAYNSIEIYSNFGKYNPTHVTQYVFLCVFLCLARGSFSYTAAGTENEVILPSTVYISIM